MILRPHNAEDVSRLAATLRDCDRQEIALGSGMTPQEAVSEAVAASTFAQAIEAPGGAIAAIWGVAPVHTPASPDRLGSIWLLGSDELEAIPLSFLRACKPAIAEQHRTYPTLVCAAWRENALHLNWLRWLGFTQNDVGHPHFIPHFRNV